MSSESVLWFLGLAGKWVQQAPLSCLHKEKESRNQWAVFTGYTADCNTARYVTHSQAVKTDELLGRAQPGQPHAKGRKRRCWHTGQERRLAPSSSLSKKWNKFQKEILEGEAKFLKWFFFLCGHFKDKQKKVAIFLYVKVRTEYILT